MDIMKHRTDRTFSPMSAGDNITFSASRNKALLLLLGAICFVAAGVWTASAKPVLGWACILFFGLGIPVSFAMLLPGSTYLKLDAEGFEIASMFRMHKTRWTDVAGFEIYTLKHHRMIGIVYNATYHDNKFSRALASSVAGMEGAIPNNYDASLNDIIAALRAWQLRFGRMAP